MYTIFAILIIITSILLVLVVLVQNPKGGGLSSTFGGGGNQIMGAKKTTRQLYCLYLVMLHINLNQFFDHYTHQINILVNWQKIKLYMKFIIKKI